MKLTSELASLRVRAALGRAPQDQLEATVVLESWGVSSDLALTVAGPDVDAGPMPSWRVDSDVRHTGNLQDALEIIGLLAGIVAATMWAGPIISRLGGSAIDAWRVSLPVTLLLQWTLRRYYRSFSERGQRERLSGLRNAAWGLGIAPMIAVTVPVLLVFSPVAGAATSLVVLWTGGLLLTRRGWAPAYVALLLGGALAVTHRVSVVPVIGGESEAMLAMVVVAVATSRPARHLPGHWLEALKSGCVGAALGCMMVSVGFPRGAASVRLLGLAMAPGLLGSVVWFYLVAEFWHLLRPGVDVTRGSDSLTRTHRMSRLINLAGLTGYVVATVALSLAALAVASALGISSSDPSIIFLDLGTIGLASVLFAWLDVLGRAGTALVVEACALGAGLLVHSLGARGLAPYGALFAAALAAVLAEVVVYRLHGEPEWMAARIL
jgi:hypothetical protein